MKEDFQHIIQLIQNAKERVYVKANSELVALYFNVGNILSDKISKGVWGDKTMTALADFIHTKMPNLSGFNRRGLYRMKQFYEIHAVNSEVFKLWEEVVFSIEHAETQDVLIVPYKDAPLAFLHLPQSLFLRFHKRKTNQIQG